MDVPKHIPRGWERAPQSPHIVRTKGRKVWKRPDIKAKDTGAALPFATTGLSDDGAREPLTEKSANTSRPVKRLRLKDAPGNTEQMESTKPFRYLTTMRDGAAGSPRS